MPKAMKMSLATELLNSGVPEMQKLKTEIEYKFEETEHGATIHILTDNRNALSAIHKFLRFQVKEHQTVDSLEVSP